MKSILYMTNENKTPKIKSRIKIVELGGKVMYEASVKIIDSVGEESIISNRCYTKLNDITSCI